MPPQNPVSTSYQIEISGWDQTEKFFVETTELDWSGENDKRLHLRRPLRVGALVFVRLIPPTASVHSVPVAYQVKTVSDREAAGMWQICLTRLNPRLSANAGPAQTPAEDFEEKLP